MRLVSCWFWVLGCCFDRCCCVVTWCLVYCLDVAGLMWLYGWLVMLDFVFSLVCDFREVDLLV